MDLTHYDPGWYRGKLGVLVMPECSFDGYMVRRRKECAKARPRARSVSGRGQGKTIYKDGAKVRLSRAATPATKKASGGDEQ